MKIQELELQNFHGFDFRNITFDKNFTVLIGDNGSGKTAILDGLSVALGSYISGFSGIKSRYILKEEIYKKHYMYGKKLDIQPQYPVVVLAKGFIEDDYLEKNTLL